MPNHPIDAIYHPISLDAGLGEFSRERNHGAHVEQLIRQVLFTAPGERINRPEFGCGLRQMVFAPNSGVTAGLVKVSVFQALDRWLKGVIKVQEVDANAFDEKLEIRIAYILLSHQERRLLSLEVAL